MAVVDAYVQQTNWPTKLYVGMLAFAFVSLAIFTPALDGRAMNAGRGYAQLAICAVLGLRLTWAIYRKEHSKMWVPYVVGMLLAVPIWLVVEPLVLSLGRG